MSFKPNITSIPELDPSIENDIRVELASIRQSLNLIPDVEEALNALTSAEKVEALLSKSSDFAKEASDALKSQQKANLALLTRVVAQNVTFEPTHTPDTTGFSNLADVIKSI